MKAINYNNLELVLTDKSPNVWQATPKNGPPLMRGELDQIDESWFISESRRMNIQLHDSAPDFR